MDELLLLSHDLRHNDLGVCSYQKLFLQWSGRGPVDLGVCHKALVCAAMGLPATSAHPILLSNPHPISILLFGGVFSFSAFLEEQFLSQPETTIDVTSVVQYVSASVRFVVVAQSYTLSEISVFDWVGVGIGGGPDSNAFLAFVAMRRICIQATNLSGHALNHSCPRSDEAD